MKQKLLAFAQKFGILAKVKDGTVTAEDWSAFAKGFQDEHGVDILAAIEEANKTPKLEKAQQDILAALFSGSNANPVNPAAPAANPPAASPEGSAQPSQPVVAAEGDTNAQILAGIQQLTAKIAKLEKEPESSNPQGTLKPVNAGAGMKVIPINSRVSTDTHLFGIDHDFFALSKPWNKVSATGMALPSVWNKKDENSFMGAFNDYAASFAERLNQLQLTGEIGTISATAIDFTGFDGTGWGEQYLVRRQDALIAYIRTLPSVRNIFPVQYGVQDKQVMTNSFLTQFSQAYQKGKVFKGTHSVEPVLAEVFDVMFKHQFEDMKQLEREYIGYLNREASSPIKWSMIEWLMSKTLVQLNNEWNQRRILGYRIAPVAGTAGHHMFGSDGVLRKLWKYAEDLYLEPFADLKLYTAATVLAFVESFVENVNQTVPTLTGQYLYMNEKHIPWFLAAYRTKYGTDLDFDGAKMEVKNYSTFGGIKAVPNMGNSCMMWITMENNIELYEDKAGEMADFYFERELETLISASWWKEGSGAYMIGKKYASAAALAASKRKDQYIFMTNPVFDLVADATTADGTKCDRFATVANTGATAITDITGASEGIVYRIECGHVTNATTIAKANKFSELTAAWTPTAVGDFLEVYWNAATSKFVEVRRKVTA
ncbi:MAG TPA: hypothetical protein VFG54_12235 [Prolixibacteraceae bacterium]|nr:hypothetical protein [Prolixibacteraceae bacterium]